MSLFQRLRNALSRFMYGRNGADQLGLCIIWVAILLDVISMLTKNTAVSGVVGMITTVLVLWALLRRGHSVLTTVTLLLLATGVLCVGVEFCCDRFLLGRWSPGWSVVVLVCCVGLCIPLVVVRRVASLREEVRRRFHF